MPGPNTKKNLIPMRSLKSTYIGALVSLNGIVVRTTDVKPFLKVACYACDVCGYEAYQIIASRTYMPLVDCPSKRCVDNQIRGKLYQQTRASKFISFQEIRVQEPSDQVPIGHVPRSLTIYAFGECTKQCSPGNYFFIFKLKLVLILFF